MENSKEIKEFINERKSLFWYIPENEKENINQETLVEFILNFGNDKDVKRLFELVGLTNVSKIFQSQIKLSRNNYFKPVRHYFNLYFNKYVH
ncbi:MAG: hypothetical protein COS14_01605 [Bacteroidetes bacterium CG02_land_8_20_14_3_00_31_25]|nr:hypothetical protein [Bacteroidota bacterium]OFX35500.1 MAG: hypothetical protein A2X08_15905 [Bacteroidetes bacterium GWA2_32_17]PIV62776.1 MAG: hypothetical protein COS14_01605 [Bacteroidetes bacterium CG02_land_8_20_14_3_00_31_25]